MEETVLAEVVGSSKNDAKRGWKFPKTITPQLAEDIGIMAGDGHIGFYKRGSTTDYEVEVAGNGITDYRFLSEYVRNLKLSLFGLKFRFFLRLEINTCYLKTRSQGLVEFYTKIIQLPLENKKGIHIPKRIMGSEDAIKQAFLRGLGDTDFTFSFMKKYKEVQYYPHIKLGTESKNLVLDTKELLEDLGFNPTICLDGERIHPVTKKPFVNQQLELYGKKNYEKWVSDIGFSNPKNWLKYRLWKENGFCPPNAEIERMMSEPRGI